MYEKRSLNKPMLTEIILDTSKIFFILVINVALFFKLAWHSLARTGANY